MRASVQSNQTLTKAAEAEAEASARRLEAMTAARREERRLVDVEMAGMQERMAEFQAHGEEEDVEGQQRVDEQAAVQAEATKWHARAVELEEAVKTGAMSRRAMERGHVDEIAAAEVALQVRKRGDGRNQLCVVMCVYQSECVLRCHIDQLLH